MPVSPMRSQPPRKQEAHLFFLTTVHGAPRCTLVSLLAFGLCCNECQHVQSVLSLTKLQRKAAATDLIGFGGSQRTC